MCVCSAERETIDFKRKEGKNNGGWEIAFQDEFHHRLSILLRIRNLVNVFLFETWKHLFPE